jgi:Cd2+/Zn2+-exporting ATPase/Cu+-exporting ATPase
VEDHWVEVGKEGIASHRTLAMTEGGEEIASQSALAMTEGGEEIASQSALAMTEGGEGIASQRTLAMTEGREEIASQRTLAMTEGGEEIASQRTLAMTAEARQWKAAQEGLGRSVLLVQVDGELAGMLAAADRLRDEAPAAIAALRALGIEQIELLTGDNERAAAELAGRLGVDYRAGLLPQDKIQIVKDYQARGKVVVMVGDGINDAPALAQAEAGIAMGAAGSDLAIEAAHVALMREDWRLVPDLLRIARRTRGVVKGNIAFTAAYNLVGLSLAAFGLLPPVLAAAAQSLPDLIILGNSARLIRQK